MFFILLKRLFEYFRYYLITLFNNVLKILFKSVLYFYNNEYNLKNLNPQNSFNSKFYNYDYYRNKNEMMLNQLTSYVEKNLNKY